MIIISLILSNLLNRCRYPSLATCGKDMIAQSQRQKLASYAFKGCLVYTSVLLCEANDNHESYRPVYIYLPMHLRKMSFMCRSSN